jgi:hypothetical protein
MIRRNLGFPGLLNLGHLGGGVFSFDGSRHDEIGDDGVDEFRVENNDDLLSSRTSWRMMTK